MSRALKWAAVLGVVFGLAYGFVRLEGRKGYGLKTGDAAPALRLPMLDGSDGDLVRFRGRVVLLNFWASWCGPCVEEMPALERLHRRLAAEGLVVLGVSADEDERTVRAFVDRNRVTFPIWRDPGGREASRSYRTTGYPETFIVDQKGTLVRIVIGPAEWDSNEAVEYFRGLLGSGSG